MPAPAPMNQQHRGFTMMEALVAIALCGLLAVFMVPKLMQTSGQEQAAVLVQDAYTTVGELYLAREKDSKLAAPDIGGIGEQDVFRDYLLDNLRIKNTAAAWSPGATPCNTDQNITLLSGPIIQRICSVSTTNPDTLQVTIRVPNGNSNVDFILVIPEDAAGSGASTERYTTLYGFKRDNGLAISMAATPPDCGFADITLKLTETCP